MFFVRPAFTVLFFIYLQKKKHKWLRIKNFQLKLSFTSEMFLKIKKINRKEKFLTLSRQRDEIEGEKLKIKESKIIKFLRSFCDFNGIIIIVGCTD